MRGSLAALALVTAATACGDDEVIADRDARGTADASGDDRDARGGDASPADAGPLATTLGDSPYLIGTDGVDVTSVVVGGAPPYDCSIYTGAGRGTVPGGVAPDLAADASGCTLAGGVDVAGAGDLPGSYGFLVVVTDSAGASVDVPIAYQGPPCSTAAVTVTPEAWPPLVAAPGTAQSWAIEISDLDGVDTGMVCDACLSMSLLTRGPLTLAAGLDCANPGDLCSDCDGCVTFVGGCPGTAVATASRTVDLAVHGALRPDGAPAWATNAMSAAYSGVSLNPCTGKFWDCHTETLELP